MMVYIPYCQVRIISQPMKEPEHELLLCEVMENDNIPT
jgi:hypothetical protein